MKLKIYLLITTLLTVSGLLWYENTHKHPQTPAKTPLSPTSPYQNLTFTALNGAQIPIKTLKASRYIIHVWATWCPPCIHELPDLITYAKTQPNSQFILINAGESLQKISAFLTKNIKNHTAPNILWAQDKNRTLTAQTLGIYQLPETHILSKNKSLIQKIQGAKMWLKSPTL